MRPQYAVVLLFSKKPPMHTFCSPLLAYSLCCRSRHFFLHSTREVGGRTHPHTVVAPREPPTSQAADRRPPKLQARDTRVPEMQDPPGGRLADVAPHRGGRQRVQQDASAHLHAERQLRTRAGGHTRHDERQRAVRRADANLGLRQEERCVCACASYRCSIFFQGGLRISRLASCGAFVSPCSGVFTPLLTPALTRDAFQRRNHRCCHTRGLSLRCRELRSGLASSSFISPATFGKASFLGVHSICNFKKCV